MQIVIDIPKEFENHFNSDKFEDSLQRVRFDIHKAFVGVFVIVTVITIVRQRLRKIA